MRTKMNPLKRLQNYHASDKSNNIKEQRNTLRKKNTMHKPTMSSKIHVRAKRVINVLFVDDQVPKREMAFTAVCHS